MEDHTTEEVQKLRWNYFDGGVHLVYTQNGNTHEFWGGGVGLLSV